jgi:hypothetical protein
MMDKKDYQAIGLLMIICGAMGFIIGFLVGSLVSPVFGENYIYNFTNQEWRDFRLMALCPDMEESEVMLPDLIKFCKERYGGINSTYGDKIK